MSFSSFFAYPIVITEKLSRPLVWLGPLLARLIVGEIFFTSGWGKLNNLPAITENFISWGIPFAEVLTPLVSGIEFIGGIALVLGLYTRFFSGALAVIMLVAIKSALWEQVDSLDTLLGFSESAYFGIFVWLAAVGAGKISIDYWWMKQNA